ncbi:hypothetical protein GCM10027515_20250 [Schumannella luteola]|uniref:Uncharacterized protein n=1 Tax=Schumannella luteola TaxID=472059 RepID=A0A852YLV9_9MICO|nr:hypothetical protein [Schumannella luteola]NYH00179.1 hypothetical protein [Schumannella luteola]
MTAGAPQDHGRAATLETRETPVLDLVYVIGALAVFALIALLGKAVEKL